MATPRCNGFCKFHLTDSSGGGVLKYSRFFHGESVNFPRTRVPPPRATSESFQHMNLSTCFLGILQGYNSTCNTLDQFRQAFTDLDDMSKKYSKIASSRACALRKGAC